MQSLQARIDSFRKTKRVKRHPNKQSSATASVKWPHPSNFKANANTLAEAGFYYNPSWDDRDSVTCFLCGKELSDWDAEDDPFEIHYTKCQNSCPWALVRCGLTDDIDSSSKAMEKARLDTFGQNWWPHDGVSGNTATSLKMAEAGFVYTPQAVGDDTVTCLYCNLSLGGWEKGDDPIEEHHKRGSKSGDTCPFLTLTTKPVPDAPPRAKRGKTSTAIPPKPRRKTRATRGKSVKPPPTTLHRSPSLPLGEDESYRIRSPAPPNGTASLPLVVSKADHSNHSLAIMPQHDPALSVPPVIVDSQVLTPLERAMSLEQWIRREISLSYEKLSSDGQQQIRLFKEKAAELRRCIDEL